MDCPLKRELITAYVDGELNPVEYDRIREHIASCSKCRFRIEEEARAKEFLRSKLKFTPAPPHLREKIIKGLNEIDAAQKPAPVHSLFRSRSVTLHYRLSHLFSAAAALIIVLSGVLYLALNTSGPDSPQFSVTSPEVLRIQSVSWKDCALQKDAEGNIILTGRLVCIGCEFTQKYNIFVDCAKHGHHFVLLTDHGLYVDFTPNERSISLLHEQQVAGLKVKIVGKLCTRSNYMDIVNYEKLPV